MDIHKNARLTPLGRERSRPQQLYRPTPQPVVDRIEALRRQRLTGQAIAAETGVSAATVSRVLKRLGLDKLSALEPAEPVIVQSILDGGPNDAPTLAEAMKAFPVERSLQRGQHINA